MSNTCNCNCSQRILGDGCEICNPQFTIELLRERVTKLETLEAKILTILEDNPNGTHILIIRSDLINWISHHD